MGFRSRLVRRSHRSGAAVVGRDRSASTGAVRLLRNSRWLGPAEVPWQRGRGYDIEGLTNLITGNDVWAKHVLAQLKRRIDNLDTSAYARLLRQCRARAVHGARVNEAGVRRARFGATAQMTNGPAALSDLAGRRITVLFSVDLFNEGIDIPEVDTLLMLRPTDSAPCLSSSWVADCEEPRQDGLHRPGFCRPPSEGIPFRSASRRHPHRKSKATHRSNRAGLPVPAGGLPHGA